MGMRTGKTGRGKANIGGALQDQAKNYSISNPFYNVSMDYGTGARTYTEAEPFRQDRLAIEGLRRGLLEGMRGGGYNDAITNALYEQMTAKALPALERSMISRGLTAGSTPYQSVVGDMARQSMLAALIQGEGVRQNRLAALNQMLQPYYDMSGRGISELQNEQQMGISRAGQSLQGELQRAAYNQKLMDNKRKQWTQAAMLAGGAAAGGMGMGGMGAGAAGTGGGLEGMFAGMLKSGGLGKSPLQVQ